MHIIMATKAMKRWQQQWWWWWCRWEIEKIYSNICVDSRPNY